MAERGAAVTRAVPVRVGRVGRHAVTRRRPVGVTVQSVVQRPQGPSFLDRRVGTVRGVSHWFVLTDRSLLFGITIAVALSSSFAGVAEGAAGDTRLVSATK